LNSDNLFFAIEASNSFGRVIRKKAYRHRSTMILSTSCRTVVGHQSELLQVVESLFDHRFYIYNL